MTNEHATISLPLFYLVKELSSFCIEFCTVRCYPALIIIVVTHLNAYMNALVFITLQNLSRTSETKLVMLLAM